MTTGGRAAALRLLSATPWLLFLAIAGVFGVLAPQFFTAQNAFNILVQASSTAIVATGMTLVLLTAGVDLSVGAIMFIAAAVAGKLVLGGAGLPAALLAAAGIGTACGLVNALFITRLKILPFVVTLATLYAGRGLALQITQTRAMNLPSSFLEIGSAKLLGVPLPVIVLAAVVVLAQLTLSLTPFGRQLYAIGGDAEAARRAGVRVSACLVAVYAISGLFAGVAAMISLSQLGAVSPKFGENYEFKAIAATVLGGTSLFGGRGSVLPGALLGAVLIQTVEAGLVIVNPDPYLYPLVTSAVIFVAVFFDSLRSRLLARLHRRPIYAERPAE